MKEIGTVITCDDTYRLYQYDNDDYSIVAINGDWSIRGTKADMVKELADLGLSFDTFQ